ncbi:hypothetical protein G8A07_15505 [Roseateles sp. DAIF2]|uniref:hypothetical protein n=1 Tax=Roseateles sp. DAIF2 TaxID=2714952 RepID=UPI0018A24FD9|nr:hypothetical protein [Roseateles sp. DAIF2]QPF74182.1 hypothetical protein G8A07_15505 [Roseateles sp. DAIF2]
MSSPIQAIVPLRPVMHAGQGQSGASSGPAVQVGDTLRLTVAAGAQGQLQALNEQGVLLANIAPGSAQVGDVLLLRVLATQPRLELQMLERQPTQAGTAGQPASAALEESGALRTDQAWLLAQRLHSARATVAPEMTAPASLALQWRGRLLAEAAQGPSAAPEQATASLHLPGWNGHNLQLRLLTPPTAAWLPHPDEPAARDEESSGGRQPPHPEPEDQQQGEGLRLGLILSLGGEWVQVVLQWQQGLLLHFSAEKAETLQALRGLMPRISAALAAVPLPLRHCQLSSRPPAVPPLPRERLSQGLAHGSSGALFRAAAEVAGVLQRA